MRADRLNRILHCVKDDAEVSVDIHGRFASITGVHVSAGAEERIVIVIGNGPAVAGALDEPTSEVQVTG